MKTGFKDKNGKDLFVGDTVRTYDRKGKRWVGKIIVVNPKLVIRGSNPQFAFESKNYATWINNQEYASELEILGL